MEVLFQIGRVRYHGKRQHDRFATLDRMEVMNNRFGETFQCDTAEAAQSIKRSTCVKIDSFKGLQLAIPHHGECHVLRYEISYVYEARSIGVDAGSLLEQIDGNALAVDYEDSLPKGT